MTIVASDRTLLLELFQAGLRRVEGFQCTFEALEGCRGDAHLDLVAIGKAAGAMAQGTVRALGNRVGRGLVITKDGHLPAYGDLPENFVCRESGHPLPDQRSFQAGAQLLDFLLQRQGEGAWLFLISGGASSLVEVLPAGVTLDALCALNEWLQSSGYPIAAINRVRKACSLIKGGRLAAYLGGRRTRLLMISDVEGNDPASIGSGLLSPELVSQGICQPDLPGWIQDLLQRAPVLPRREDPEFSCVTEPRIIASLDDALQAVVDAATAQGIPVSRDPEWLAGDAIQQGARIGRLLCETTPGLFLWGGETTVRLPAHPGLGGRNQSLALAAAIEIDGHDDVCLLAAGTDGSDGPTDAAGALIDGGTIGRGSQESLDATRALDSADAGTFLSAAGDLIDTGPTGTNVNDMVIGLKR